ncbi:hypothetical protein HC776_01165 [bacterium]|nr:hypothetical protein [bacterium]
MCTDETADPPVPIENIVEQVSIEDRRERLTEALNVAASEILAQPVVAKVEARRILKEKEIDRGR